MRATLDHGVLSWLILAFVVAIVSLNLVGRVSTSYAARRTRRALEAARRVSES